MITVEEIKKRISNYHKGKKKPKNKLDHKKKIYRHRQLRASNRVYSRKNP